MNFLAVVFGAALAISLVTGKAFFRGTYTRDEDPQKYWTIIGCYAVLMMAGLILPLVPSAAGGRKGDGASTSSRFGLPFDLLTDAATRLAAELENGAARARHAADGRAVVVHRPKPSPEGCADDYRVQFSQASSLVIWCSAAGKITSSHTTTSHLPAVAVPRTWIVDKRAGEALLVTLEMRGNRVVVVEVE